MWYLVFVKYNNGIEQEMLRTQSLSLADSTCLQVLDNDVRGLYMDVYVEEVEDEYLFSI